MARRKPPQAEDLFEVESKVIDVDVQEPECTAFRTLPIPATLLFEILRCFAEQTLRNSEASGELGVVFIDDDRDLHGEIGDAVSTVSFVK